MRLEHISLLNYKNIAQAELTFAPCINCIIGRNGEGKTNLLDAIHFLSLCKSANISQDSLCIRHEQQSMFLQGRYLTDNNDSEEISIGLIKGQKKVVRRGKKAYKRIAEHIGLIPLVIVSPSNSPLITGGSEERRRFMDIVISQKDASYLNALMRYNKALAQRNTLLKMEEGCDLEILSLWEEQMATEGEQIYAKRAAFIDEFRPIFQHYYNYIAQDHEEVKISYSSHCQRGPLLEIIQKDRNRDLAVGYSLHGIHRDELEMSVDGYNLRYEGSQGQKKTVIIAMKLAEYDFLNQSLKNKPILLLDDIFDKLDSLRVERIVNLVREESFGQTFITDTNRENLDRILSGSTQEYRLFTCEKGEFK